MIRTPALLAAALVALALPEHADAQTYPTDRGSFIVAGGATASTSAITFDDDGEDRTERVSSVNLSPRVQYFVTPGLAVGGALSATLAWRDGGSNSQFGVGPQVSYYFGRGDRRVYPFLSAGVSYEGIGEEYSSFGQNAAAGLVFMLSRGVGLDGSLFYRRAENDSATLNSFGLALGVTAFAF